MCDLEALATLARTEAEARTKRTATGPFLLDRQNPDPRTLDRYGLPHPPDRALLPELHAAWIELLSSGEVLKPSHVYLPRVRHAMAGESSPYGREARPPVARAGRWMTSRNWSGAVIAADHGSPMQVVMGRWRVPAPSLPPEASPAAPPPGNAFQCSVWIGLDGWRRSSLSLPQVGTVSAMQFRNGQFRPECYLFAQWWVRGKNYAEAKIANFCVRPEDEILAMVTVTGFLTVRLTVANLTWPQLFTEDWQPGKVESGEITLPDIDAPVEGRHAVWCVERPTIHPRPAQGPIYYQLPRFAAATFREARGAAWPKKPPHWPVLARDLAAPRLVRMVEGAVSGSRGGLAWLTSPDGAPRPPITLTVSQRT
jgi:hypothetical protein